MRDRSMIAATRLAAWLVDLGSALLHDQGVQVPSLVLARAVRQCLVQARSERLVCSTSQRLPARLVFQQELMRWPRVAGRAQKRSHVRWAYI